MLKCGARRRECMGLPITPLSFSIEGLLFFANRSEEWFSLYRELFRGIRRKMPPSFLTRPGYQRLQEELEQLRTVKRQEVANRLREAMEGAGGDMGVDLDAEYEAAKNEQAFVEGRIQELEILLANARVIQDSGTREVVEVGATVTIRDGENEPEVYTVVGRAEANPREGRISNESPLGRALMDHRAGDDVKVEAPGGSFTVHILKVE